MKRRIAWSWVLAAAVLTSGCSSPWERGQEPRCLDVACPPDPGSTDYRLPLEQWGLYQVNNDMGREAQPQVDGDLASWQVDTDVVGSNLAAGRLFPIAVDDIYLQSLPLVSDGHVVFFQRPLAGSPDAGLPEYLVLWDWETSRPRKVETGLVGPSLPYAFDWPWVVFQHKGPRANGTSGYWAINLESNEKVQLWRAPDPDLPETASPWGAPFGQGVTEGMAYMTFSDEATAEDYTTRLVEYNLAEGTSRVVYETPGDPPGRTTARGPYVVWETRGFPGGSKIMVYNRTVGVASPVWTQQEGHASFPSVGGDWATFNVEPANGTGEHPILAVHLPTGRRVTIVPDGPTDEFSAQESSTDGERVIVGALRQSQQVFDTVQNDLYWRWLPVWNPTTGVWTERGP